jgi:DNA-binding XRE family transcriptional regulator
MSTDDKFEDVLKAFANDLEEPVEQEELDRRYSQAISGGLINEAELEGSFEEFLSRCVEVVPDNGEVRLAPRLTVTVGAFVKECRSNRGLTEAQFAQELKLSSEELIAIEACSEAYDPEQVVIAARALAAAAPRLTPAGAQRLLQRIRVMSGIQEAPGPRLKAARRRPDK